MVGVQGPVKIFFDIKIDVVYHTIYRINLEVYSVTMVYDVTGSLIFLASLIMALISGWVV